MPPQKKLSSLSDLQQLLPDSYQPEQNPQQRQHDGKGKTLRLRLDTHGRKGKSVTIISGLQHNPDTMEEIATILKQHCGAGGTVKGKEIEIQGDQRTRLAEKLRTMGYVVKEG